MKYIMITHFDDHWDGIDSTSYTASMFRKEMGQDKIGYGNKIETLFIRKTEGINNIEGCWLGRTYDFKPYKTQQNKDATRFSVEIIRSIDCPPKYQNYPEGWYCEDWELEGLSGSEFEPKKQVFDPPFFSTVKTTKNSSEFEDLAYFLLKALGLHTIYRFPPRAQRGKADGFFIFSTLAVLFDMTLERDFEGPKGEQIENFCDQLRRGIIKHGSEEFHIGGNMKQVWIITRGSSREIKKINTIPVKEVSINKLIGLYRERFTEDLDEAAFMKKLQEI